MERTVNGLILNRATGEYVPGAILGLWLELRRAVGVVEAKKKEGVRFKVRSAEDLIDKIRDKANELGILIYPRVRSAKGVAVEDGTMAEQELEVYAQAVSDGSQLMFAGFGLGADNQDKAGGKAGTYAFKAALIQALLAGGKENAKALGVTDTDDSDSPIDGGVRRKTPGKQKVTDEAISAAFSAAADRSQYDAAVKLLMTASPERQMGFKDAVMAARTRLSIESKTP